MGKITAFWVRGSVHINGIMLYHMNMCECSNHSGTLLFSRLQLSVWTASCCAPKAQPVGVSGQRSTGGDTQTQTFRDADVSGGTLRLFWELFIETQRSMTCGIITFFLDYLDLKIVGSQNPNWHWNLIIGLALVPRSSKGKRKSRVSEQRPTRARRKIF